MATSSTAKPSQEVISSRDNRWLKRFRAALESAPIKREDCVGLEGPRLVEEAFRSGLVIEAVLVSDEGDRHLTRLKPWLTREVRILRCSQRMFQGVASTDSPQGIAALAHMPEREFEELLGARPLVLVLVGVQDPGNVGTLLRSAEAFGATGAVTCRGTAHPLSPKALRASAGSALRLPLLATADDASVLARLREAKVRIYAATLEGVELPRDVDFCVPCALLIGNESSGLPAEMARAADERVRIALADGVESLNAGVAGAVLLYEASRQRNARLRAGRPSESP